MSAPPPGGPNYFLIALAVQLRERGWNVHVAGQDGPCRLTREAYAVRDFPVLCLWRSCHLPEEKAARLSCWIAQEKPDIFLISNCIDAGWVSLASLPPAVRVVTVAHADVSAYYKPVAHYARFIDRAVGVSPQIARKLAQQSGLPQERCPYIPYGVQTLDAAGMAGKSEPAGQLRVAYVGRLVEDQKRVSRLTPILAELKRRKVPLDFAVIGDGPCRAELEASLKPHGVTFHGWLDGTNLRARLADLDVLVLVSDSEGLPIAILEAMGHGVVPVASNIDSGITEVIQDGVNGFLAPPADTQGFADRIQCLAQDPAMRRSMRQAAWSTSQAYTVERMGSAYESLFAEVLRSPARGQAEPNFPIMPSCRSRYPAWLRKVKSRALDVWSRLLS